MRVLLFLGITAQQPASPPPPPPSAGPPKRTVALTGAVLMNGFYNSARTNNSDDPVFADTDAVGVTGSSATMRPNGRFRNFVCEGHGGWRPPGPLIFAFEFRRLQARYQAGDFTVNHLNLAGGFRF